VSRLDLPLTVDSLKALAQEFREPPAGPDLVRLWARAGAESLEALTPLRARSDFGVEVLPAAALKSGRSVLGRLRDHLLGNKPARVRLDQDTSLQIVGCPGVLREAETVYDSIVHNLQIDPSLRQTD